MLNLDYGWNGIVRRGSECMESAHIIIISLISCGSRWEWTCNQWDRFDREKASRIIFWKERRKRDRLTSYLYTVNTYEPSRALAVML